MRKLRLGRSPSEYGGAAAQSWVRLLLLSFSSTRSPGSTEASLLCHSSLSPACSIQAAGGGQLEDFAELNGNCPASPNAITFLLYMALHTHISLPHAPLSHAHTHCNLDTHACGRHKGTGSIHPTKRNLMHSCSHLSIDFIDTRQGL